MTLLIIIIIIIILTISSGRPCAVYKANVPSMKERSGLVRVDGKWSDGSTLIYSLACWQSNGMGCHFEPGSNLNLNLVQL